MTLHIAAPKGWRVNSQGWSAAQPLEGKRKIEKAPTGRPYRAWVSHGRPVGATRIGWLGFQGLRCAPPLAIDAPPLRGEERMGGPFRPDFGEHEFPETSGCGAGYWP